MGTSAAHGMDETADFCCQVGKYSEHVQSKQDRPISDGWLDGIGMREWIGMRGVKLSYADARGPQLSDSTLRRRPET